MIIPSYTRFGGLHTDSAVLCNTFHHAGVLAPHSRRPYTEAMIAGLGGGIGFSYFVYEQRAEPARLDLNSRFQSRRQDFIDGVLKRSGVRVAVSQTSSPRRAQDDLFATLDSGRAAICTVDPPLLPHRGLPLRLRGRTSQLVSVIGTDGDDVLIDDLCQEPIRLSADQLSAARQSYRRARQRMMVVAPPLVSVNPAAAVREALVSTCRLFLNPPVSNFGFAGLEKWASLLTNQQNRRGWPRLFAPPRALFSALHHTYTHLRYERAAPGAMRPMFADFLEEAADILGRRRLLSIASQYRRSAELWGQLTDLALPIEDATLWRCRAISERRRDLLRTGGVAATAEMQRLWRELETLGRRFSPSWSEADRLFRFRAMARILRAIRSVELSAVTALRQAVV
ncbi:MAG: hypothetical protein ACI8RZ_003175 [Myxococcota bacterium]|jgi:hypothetical protein